MEGMPICATCGVQGPGPDCPVCQDDRQYVPPTGQRWTTQSELQASHKNVFRELEPGVWSIHTEPNFAIGQHAHLIQTPEGNLLWDCVALLDAETIATIHQLGGIRAIAVSHPHYYSTMSDWAETFNAPLWIHQNEANWVQEPGAAFWDGATKSLFGGLTLICSGGHFEGYQVAHWDRGVLFAGDQPQVCLDRRWVSFLYSYPNMIPFNARQIRAICSSLEPWNFDRLYGAFGRNILTDAKGAVERSAVRYLTAIADPD
jgi:hypothetical protein